MKIKTIVFQVVLFFCLMSGGWAQNANDTVSPAVEVEYGVDLVSRYIWRGLEFGHAPSIQPSVSASWNGFTLGAWGAYKTSGEGAQETDLYLSKTIGPLTIALWDYFSFYDTSAMDFLDYKEGTTAHLLEAQALFKGGDLVPLNFVASYFFYGSDTTRSLYFELQFQREFSGTGLMAFVGYSPKGQYYGSREGVVNLGVIFSRDIAITDYLSVPCSMSLIYNPDVRSLYLVAAFSF